MVQILPSLASANQLFLMEEIKKAEKLGCIHFDIEDGNFVPNITFGMKTIKSVCSVLPDLRFDAHLMVTDPEAYLDSLGELNFEAVAFHWEAAPYPGRLIHKIHRLGMRAGIALNPRTEACQISGYVNLADYILLMSSEPDGCGETFQRSVLKKIQFIKKNYVDAKIVVDGGINQDNFHEVTEAGAAKVVLGRAFFQPGSNQFGTF